MSFETFFRCDGYEEAETFDDFNAAREWCFVRLDGLTVAEGKNAAVKIKLGNAIVFEHPPTVQ